MEYRHLQYKKSIISYCISGNGPQPVICFHGYSEDSGMFSFLEKYAGLEFTFYTLDLPFHGKTEWKEGLVFTPDDLRQIVSTILDLGHSESETLSQKPILLGFSLGGRMALSLYENIPEGVGKIVLLAPDGLKINFWYWLSTQTWAGQKLFHFTMKHPGWFFGFLKLINKLRFVNASVFKFVKYYIDNTGVRQLLYNRWISLRKIKPDLKVIRTLVKTNKTSVRLVYGEHDRIILPVVGKKFKKGIEEYCSLKIIQSGHQVLHEKHAEEIIQALRK